jgi:hypothetical protein
MKRIAMVGLILWILAGMAGCSSLACPEWLHPGSEDDQLRRAKRYDPFPEADMGASTTNVRPRGFENPIAEPSQARWQLNHWEP